MRKFLMIALAAVTVFTACKKADFDNTVTGEAVGPLTLLSPGTDSIALNLATPTQTITFKWTPAAPGLNATVKYRLVTKRRAAASFAAENRVFEVPSDNGGLATQLTITYKKLDDLLKATGFGTAQRAELSWTVEAYNEKSGSKLASSSNMIIFKRAPNGNGASPFQIFSPENSTTPIAIDPGSTTNTLSFNWTRSLPAAGSPVVNYTLLFAERKVDNNGNELPIDWSKPLFRIKSNNSGVDTFAKVAYKDISDSLLKYGMTDLGKVAELKWTVVANSGAWNEFSQYANTVALLREVRLYMPGSYQSASGYGNDWTPATAPEMVRDQRSGLINNMYYSYMYFPAGTEFKITQGRSWDVNYGPSTSTTGTTGDLTLNSSNNFKIAVSGVYRITVNRTTMKYDVRMGRMGFVGGAVTGVDWTPGAVFPTSGMKFVKDNYFLGIYNFGSGGWKMIDNDQWNNGSNAVDETRSYGSNGGSGSSLEVNGPNMPDITTPGTYRVIWDGTDVNNVKYFMTSGLYVIGSSTVGGWDNIASQNDTQRPPLTYMGNGVWKGTVSLVPGEIKFIVQKGSWDYNYGGSGGVLSKGGGNLYISAAGNYEITVDEYNMTYSVVYL